VGAALTRGGNNLGRKLKKVVRTIFLLEAYIVLDILYPLSYNSMYVAKPGNATHLQGCVASSRAVARVDNCVFNSTDS